MMWGDMGRCQVIWLCCGRMPGDVGVCGRIYGGVELYEGDMK